MFVYILAEELVKLGHEVTVFASGDSNTSARLKSIYDEPQTFFINQAIPELLHGIQVYKEADKYDIIHDNTNCGPPMAYFVNTPVLVTLHGDFNESAIKFYSNFANDAYYNSISDYQRNCYPDLNYIGTIYHAINFKRYRHQDKKEDFLLSFSRICLQKGTHLAAEAAFATGSKLIIAGKIDTGQDREYFEEKVRHLIDDKQIIYAGEASDKEKIDLMARAKCLLFPIQWAEPFGLAMIEALASGTPVIAMRNGSVPELIKNGETGFVVDNLDEMIEAIKNINKISPNTCRKDVEARFVPRVMANNYVEAYKKIIDDYRRKK